VSLRLWESQKVFPSLQTIWGRRGGIQKSGACSFVVFKLPLEPFQSHQNIGEQSREMQNHIEKDISGKDIRASCIREETENGNKNLTMEFFCKKP
jgi:hypothetical protein